MSASHHLYRVVHLPVIDFDETRTIYIKDNEDIISETLDLDDDIVHLLIRQQLRIDPQPAKCSSTD